MTPTATETAADLRDRAAKLRDDAQAMEHVADLLDPPEEPEPEPEPEPKPRRARMSYTPELMDRALAVVDGGGSVRDAAEAIGAPYPSGHFRMRLDQARARQRDRQQEAVLRATTGVGPSPRELEKSDLVHVTSGGRESADE